MDDVVLKLVVEFGFSNMLKKNVAQTKFTF